MIIVSVIIPVYNAEKYISECVESLLAQTETACEFIFVNDGSADRSRTLIEDLQKNDPRIILINQHNQGVSAARNAGLAVAKGEYVGFVDGDDFVAVDMYDTLYQIAKTADADIVVSDFIFEQNGHIIRRKPFFPAGIVYDREFIRENILYFFMSNDGLNSCCNKLFRRDLIASNQIRFPVGITNGEDALFNIQVFSKVQKLIFTDYYGYHYREVQGSATRNITARDYFRNAQEIFSYDHNIELGLSLDQEKIDVLKAVRFVNNVVSLIHIYFEPNTEKSFRSRVTYVNKMIKNAQLQKTIRQHWNEVNVNRNKYYKLLLNCIKRKSIVGLVLATKYSNIRNKK